MAGRWTAAENEAVRALFARTDITLDDMPARMPGRTLAAIIHQAAKMGLSKARASVFDDDLDIELSRMWLAGETMASMMEALGLTDAQIRHRRHHLGLEPRTPTSTQVASTAQRAALRLCRICQIRMEFAAGCHRSDCPAYDSGNDEKPARTLAGVASYG